MVQCLQDCPPVGCLYTFDVFTSLQTLSLYGVLQGSILRPILFSLYLPPLGHIIKQHDVSFYCNIDYTRLYLSCKPSESAKLFQQHNCLAVGKDWMAEFFPQHNSSKMEILNIGLEDITLETYAKRPGFFCTLEISLELDLLFLLMIFKEWFILSSFSYGLL